MTLTERARALDASDPLAAQRTQFKLPANTIYLDGNSLGALPSCVPERLAMAAERQWGDDLIGGWNTHHWLTLPQRVGAAIAPLLGAAPHQVIACDNLSTNLFKLLYTALAIKPERRKIITELGNFPTDNYMADGVATLLAERNIIVERWPAERFYTAAPEAFADAAVVSLTHVNFRTGAMHDLAKLTAKVRDAGALMLWDLAHSTGFAELELDANQVDMAVGCGYKFLNGGPGAPGYLYLAERHHECAETPLPGWMGHRRLFDFAEDYTAAEGVTRYLTGTQNVMGLQVLEAALEVFATTAPATLAAKSRSLTGFFMEALTQYDATRDLLCATPKGNALRGSQVSLHHCEGYAVAQALIAAGVIVDFRTPDIVRFGFAPAYNTHQEALSAVQTLAKVLDEERYRDPAFQVRKAVT